MECEFCHNKLSTKSNLIQHQTKSKKCLSIRGLIVKSTDLTENKCEFCDYTTFIMRNFKNHQQICKEKRNLDNIRNIESQLILKNSEIDQFKTQIIIKNNKIVNLNKQVIDRKGEISKLKINEQLNLQEIIHLKSRIEDLNSQLEKRSEEIDKRIQVIEHIAKQPKIIQNRQKITTNNIKYNLPKIQPDDISNHLISNIDDKTYLNGNVTNLFKAIKSGCLTAEDKSPLVILTDKSRGQIELMKNNEIINVSHNEISTDIRDGIRQFSFYKQKEIISKTDPTEDVFLDTVDMTQKCHKKYGSISDAKMVNVYDVR